MIKRPLVWVLGAYAAGMFLAWQKIHLLIIGLFCFPCFFLIYYYLYHSKYRDQNHNDLFLWVLPILILLGCYSMNAARNKPELDQAFDNQIECELTGEITMIVEKKTSRVFYVANDIVRINDEQPYLCENVIIYCSDQQNYQIGNQITVQGILQKFSTATNPGQFNEQMYYQMENIDFKMMAKQIIISDEHYSIFQAILAKLKRKLIMVYTSILSEKESGTLIAMLLGEKYLLDDEIKELYQENGISHVLAISGLHISLIGLTIYKLLRKMKVPLIPTTLISIFFIYSYGLLTNFGVSTNRAVVMMVIFLLAGIFGKTYDMLSATALSAFLILLQNPLQIFNAGFQLSYGAVLGIALLVPCFQILFPSKHTWVYGIYVSISAQVMTIPILLNFYYQLPAYSLLVNLIILPFVTVLTLASIIAGIAGMIYLPLGIFIVGSANYILRFYEWVCKIGSYLPGNLITLGNRDTLRLLLYCSLILSFLWVVRKTEKKYVILILPIALLVLFLPQRNVGFEVTMLDVGQGEAIVMETDRGSTYLIDGGSLDVKQVGKYRIQPFLLYHGVDQIDYAIITHSDSDHVCGLKELIEGNKILIKKLLLPAIGEKDEGYTELEQLAVSHGIELGYISAGDMIQDGKLSMICLHPSKGYIANSTNDSSTVISAHYGDFDMLLTGDLGQEEETLLSENFSWCPVSDYDVLKVAHHGSKYSTSSAFLSKIKPEFSLISCGKNNHFGHPNSELLERLDQINSRVELTYESGAIMIKTDGSRFTIKEYSKN